MSENMNLDQMLDDMRDAGQAGYDSGFNDWVPPKGNYQGQCRSVRPFTYVGKSGKFEGKQIFGLTLEIEILGKHGIAADKMNSNGEPVFEHTLKTLPTFLMADCKKLVALLSGGDAPEDWKEGVKLLAKLAPNAIFEFDVDKKPSKDGQTVYTNYKWLSATAA